MPFCLRKNLILALLPLGVLTLGVPASLAQSAAPSGPNPSRLDIFMGYSYFGAHGMVKPANIRYSSIDEGAMLSGAYYFNKYVGLEAVSGYHPDGQNDGMYVLSGGPIFRAPMQNFTLFAHGLVGAANLAGPNSETPGMVYHEPWRWGPSVAVGGGMDYDLPFMNHRFGLRLFQADYRFTHESYGPPASSTNLVILGGRANLSSVELSTGLLLHFGHIGTPPPVTLLCSVAAPAGTIYVGDPVTINGVTGGGDLRKEFHYSWNSTSGAVSSTTNVLTVDTAAVAPGTYTVTGRVEQGKKPWQHAECQTTFTIVSEPGPTIKCSANPDHVTVGDSSTITADARSPRGRPLSYSYTSTAGAVTGSTSTATLTTTGVAPSTINVTCSVVDNKGQNASDTTSVEVVPAPCDPAKDGPFRCQPKLVMCATTFTHDALNPTRIDNEAKECLTAVAGTLNKYSGTVLELIGHADNGEDPKAAADRAENERAYLTLHEVGVPADRLVVHVGIPGSKSVENILYRSADDVPKSQPVQGDLTSRKVINPPYRTEHPTCTIPKDANRKSNFKCVSLKRTKRKK